MRKRILMSVFSLMVLAVFIQTAQAQMINYKRRNRTTGGAPAVSASGAAAETAAAWKTKLNKVRYRAELKFDADRDGYLNRAEVTAFLRDVIAEVQDNGTMRINSAILQEYDKNGDNRIDRYEVRDIMRDISR